MLDKKIKDYSTYFIFIILLTILSLSFFSKNYKNLITNSYLYLSQLVENRNYSEKDFQNEEILALRSEMANIISEKKKLESQINLKSKDEHVEFLRLLGEISPIYQNFYLELPEKILPYEKMYVYSKGDVVVGSISQINNKNIKVGLLGQFDKVVAEIIEKEESVELSSSGVGMYVGEIPKSVEVEVGMNVIVRGYPNSTIGIISKIESNNTSIKKIWVRSPYNLLKNKIFYVKG